MSKEDKKVYKTKIAGTEYTSINDSFKIGDKQYNARKISSNGGTIKADHSVFTGNEKDKNIKYLGNVSSVLYDANEDGIKAIISILQDTGNEKRFNIVHTINRQTMSDDKNDHRSSMTRELSPYTQLKRKLEKGGLSKEQAKKVDEALSLFGMTIEDFKSKK